MSIKILLIIIFVLLVSGGIVNLIFQTKPPAAKTFWKTARPLKANHQLSAKDLEKYLPGEDDSKSPSLKDIIGKHIISDKNKEDEIKPEDLTDNPQIKAIEKDCSVIIYLLPENQMANLELINVGSQINLCSIKSLKLPADNQSTTNTICASEPIEVLAVHRKTSESSKDWLVIKFHSNKQAEITEIMASDKQILLITKNDQ